MLCVALLAMENYITRNQDVSRVNLAFMTLNSVLSIVYFLFTLLSILVET